jgi:hypothetical protein
MNKMDWDKQTCWRETSKPLEGVEGEKIYTIFMADFLRMPGVDFTGQSAFDPALLALFN